MTATLTGHETAELQNPRVLYFSDGIMNLDSDNEQTDDVPDTNNSKFTNDFTLMSRLRNNLYRIGSSILAGIDYIGEELADLFGITSKPTSNQILSKGDSLVVNPEEGALHNTENNNNGNEA